MTERSEFEALLADLLEQQAEDRRAHPRIEKRGEGVLRGEIYIAHPEPDDTDLMREYVLVVRSVPSEEYVSVLLMSDRHDLATDHDLVLTPQESGLEFKSVVHANLRAPLWTLQLDDYRGTVPDEVLDLLPKVSRGAAGDEYGFRIGTPLQSEQDLRRRYKKERLQNLQRLAASCTESVLEGRSFWAIERKDAHATELVRELIQVSGVDQIYTRPRVFKSERALPPSDDEKPGGILDPGIFMTPVDADGEFAEAHRIVLLVLNNANVKILLKKSEHIEAIVAGIKANFPRHGHLILKALFSHMGSGKPGDQTVVDLASRTVVPGRTASGSGDAGLPSPKYVLAA